jgi:MFS transporter, DHA1 family, multidrug resistance protein
LAHAREYSAIYLSVAISYLGVGLVAPLIAIVLSEHGENSFMVGLTGTAMFAAFTLASFPIGAATDRFGPKRFLTIGLVVYGVSILLFAFIKVTWLFFVVRAIEGVGGAAISVAAETMVSKLSGPHERTRRMSQYALSVGIGWAVGPIAGTLLYKIRPEAPFVACCALSMVAAICAFSFIRDPGSNSHHIERLFSVFSRRLIVPVSAGALYGFLMSSLVTLFPLYLRFEPGLNVTEVAMGAIITAVIIGTIVSQVPIGRAADRFGKQRTLLVSTILLSGVFALMASHSDWRIFIATGAIVGALAGSLYPIGLAMLGGAVNRERLGAATSLFSLAFGVGSLSGPSVSGLAMMHLGNSWLFYLPSLLTIVFVIEIIALNGIRSESEPGGVERGSGQPPTARAS